LVSVSTISKIRGLSQMGQLRRDPLHNEWVLMDFDAPLRRFSEDELSPSKEDCPFCHGNEAALGPVLYFDKEYGVKVVPNGRPLFRVENELIRHANGPYDFLSPVGAHEVLIESGEHDKELTSMSVENIASIFSAAIARMKDLTNDVRLRYHLFYKASGPLSGARLTHPHSQLIATPMVPANIYREIVGAKNYFEEKERCIFCDILDFELESSERIVSQNVSFVSYCPYTSTSPFEVCLIGRRHTKSITELGSEEIIELSHSLKLLLNTFTSTLGDPSYTITLINSPPPHPVPGDEKLYHHLPHCFHWRLKVVPRVTITTGLYLDGGVEVNSLFPEESARLLRAGLKGATA
jgi:UDPglucose--hexose-1-phosphate uridylyltransferase